jgi:ABC-type sugar transport system ATPase subunit
MVELSSVADRTVSDVTDPVPTPALIRLKGIRHRYGQTLAVRSCDFDVRAGEIHGLVGENGSGKSTIVKILSGVVRPTEGSLEWQGRPLAFRSPKAAQQHGIVTVFQETLVVEEMSGRDNIFMGQDGLFKRHASGRAELQRASDILESLGYPPGMLDRPAYSLTLGQRQIITIARALTRPWKLLILDEATSALDVKTRDRLFELVLAAVRTGSAVLFVSHRMDELGRLIDRSTVLRSGVSVGTVERAEATTAVYLRLMSGREDPLESGSRHPKQVVGASATTTGPSEQSTAVMHCRSLRVAANSEPFDLDVRSGEVLGVAGLEGHGGARFVSSLVGVERPLSGTIEVRDGRHIRTIKSYRDAFARGVVFVPGNRQVEGLFAPLSVIDNLALAMLNRLSRFGFFRATATRGLTQEYVRRLGIEAPDIDNPVSSLSGGNQQKVLVGRWLAAKPSVLVMNDPLRGVDQGTKLDFYKLLRGLADDNAAVVLLSTEIEELLSVCDRVAVFYNHALWRTLDRGELTYDEILHAMFGQTAGTSSEP